MGWGVIVQCGGSWTALLTKRYPADEIRNEMGGTRDGCGVDKRWI